MCEVFDQKGTHIDVVTPIYPMPVEKLASPDAVKVVVAGDGRALYFSRSVVPHVRGQQPEHATPRGAHWGHVGVYGYRREILRRWHELRPSRLEELEKLEQLRLLDNGISIMTYEIVANSRNTLSVDSPADLELARQLVNI